MSFCNLRIRRPRRKPGDEFCEAGLTARQMDAALLTDLHQSDGTDRLIDRPVRRNTASDGHTA
jgi:hypothetical protein